MSESRHVTDFPMTRRDVEHLYARMRDSKSYLESQRDMPDNSKSTTNRWVQGLEVFAGAAITGFAAGKLGTTSLGSTGIPAGLAAALAGHVVAHLGWAGKHSNDLANVSSGVGAGWFALWAAGQGSASRAKAGDPSPIVSGEAPHLLPQPGYGMPAAVAGAQSPLAPFAPRQMGGGGIPQGFPLSEAELQGMQQVSRRVGPR